MLSMIGIEYESIFAENREIPENLITQIFLKNRVAKD